MEWIALPVLEFVPQGKLHGSGVGQQTSVVAKVTGIGDRKAQALNVESRKVQCVEHLPAELQAVRFLPGHVPSLAEAKIQAGKTVASKAIAISGLAWEIRLEAIQCCGHGRGIPENIDRAIRVLNCSICLYTACLGCKSRQLPVCGPLGCHCQPRSETRWSSGQDRKAASHR